MTDILYNTKWHKDDIMVRWPPLGALGISDNFLSFSIMLPVMPTVFLISDDNAPKRGPRLEGVHQTIDLLPQNNKLSPL